MEDIKNEMSLEIAETIKQTYIKEKVLMVLLFIS